MESDENEISVVYGSLGLWTDSLEALDNSIRTFPPEPILLLKENTEVRFIQYIITLFNLILMQQNDKASRIIFATSSVSEVSFPPLFPDTFPFPFKRIISKELLHFFLILSELSS